MKREPTDNLIVYFKKSGRHQKAEFYSKSTGHIASSEAWNYFRDVPHANLEIRGEHKVELDRRDPGGYFLRMLRAVESENGSISFLNRIIRNGGMVEYIKKLENQS